MKIIVQDIETNRLPFRAQSEYGYSAELDIDSEHWTIADWGTAAIANVDGERTLIVTLKRRTGR